MHGQVSHPVMMGWLSAIKQQFAINCMSGLVGPAWVQIPFSSSRELRLTAAPQKGVKLSR